jgi:hypothetical protein
MTPSVTPRTVIVTRLPITIPTTAASDIVMPAISVKQTFNYATMNGWWIWKIRSPIKLLGRC